MSKEGEAMTVDRESVLKAVKGLCGVELKSSKEDSYPIPPVTKERVKEFFWAIPSAAARKTPYVHVVWIDVENTIHIETERLGNTLDMIEWIYGSEWMREFSRTNLEGFGQ